MNQKASSQKTNTKLAWTGTALWALGLFILSGISPAAVAAMQASAVAWVEKMGALLFDVSFSPAFREAFTQAFEVLLQWGSFGVLALMLWNALRMMGTPDQRAIVLSLAMAVFYAVTDELHQGLVPGRDPRILDWAMDCVGAFLAMLLLLTLRWARGRFPRLLNRETVSYVVFGVLTTLVNMVAYGIFYNALGIHNLVSNALAWVAAVLFAYVVNKLFVFRSRTDTAKALAREFGLFLAARLFSFAVDELCMGLLVNLLHANGGVAKVAVNVIVMVMNYFFSKWIIFKQQPPDGDSRPAE